MHMRVIFLLSLFLSVSMLQYAQGLNPDQVFVKFEECISKYLKSKYIHDAAYVCYYGNKLNFEFVRDRLDDGGFFYEGASHTPDSSVYNATGNRPFFYREQNFAEFLNVMLPQTDTMKCKLPVLNGTVFFVHCAEEFWEQFYYDSLLYSDVYYLTVSLDIIRSNAKEKYYKRELLVCKYLKNKGFKIDKVVIVREDRGCKS